MAPRGNKRKSRESNSSATQKFSTFYSKNSNNNDLLEGASSVFSIASWKWNSPRFLLGGTLLLILATFIEVPSPSSLFGSTITSSSSVSKNSQGIVGDALPHVTKDGKYHGAYPNSLLTLFYPFTLLRDVVLDQPVNRTDIPFFWHVHVSDEVAVKKALRKCYGADLIELDTVADISKAKNLNLISTLSNEGRLGSRTSEGGNQLYYNEQIGRPLVITSPHIREVSDLFSQDYYGRVFSFYRHVSVETPTALDDQNPTYLFKSTHNSKTQLYSIPQNHSQLIIMFTPNLRRNYHQRQGPTISWSVSYPTSTWTNWDTKN